MGTNKLLIAAAGSGKTTYLVNEALTVPLTERVLITTFTRANEKEIRKKIIKLNKFIPENITIQTWFSFLLEHGIKPYQGCVYDKKINGMILVNKPSAQYVPETNIETHYFTKGMRIYSDKIAKFVLKCNKKSNNEVIDRLSRIYSHIFIDEVQDLAGYDLDFLKLLFDSKSNTLLVGDPRQGTYSTSNSRKNQKYKKSNIVNFFSDKTINIDTDDSTLTINYRCISAICELSDKLYPSFKATASGNSKTTDHDGVYFVKKSDVNAYLNKYQPIQLRIDSRTAINDNYKVMNFGDSKGLEFERVLIYPTAPIMKWIFDNKTELAPVSKSKFYVALTRAFSSVGIVFDYSQNTNIVGISNYIN